MAITLLGANAYLYECRDEEVLLEARAGTGKTIAACKKLLDACYQYPGSRHLICRQTRNSLTDSTLVTLESVIGESHAEVTRCSRENRHSYRIGGSEIVCAGLDEPAKAFGTAWGLIVLEEAIEASLDSWELFGRTARDPKLRRESAEKTFPYAQRIAITNPGAPPHWLNQRATPCPDSLRRVASYRDLARLHEFNCGPQEGGMRRLVGVHQDNPVFFDVDKWAWMEEGQKYLDSLGKMSGHRLARMRDGYWRAASGTVFPEFDEGIHVVENFDPPSDWPFFTHWDDGYLHPTAIGWQCVAPNGDIYTADELYGGGQSVAYWAEKYREKCRGRTIRRAMGDPHGNWKRGTTGKSVAAQAAEFGIRMAPWATSHKQAQVNSYRQLLINTVNGRGRKLFIMRRCVNAIMEHQTWSYKKTRDGEIPAGDDAYVDASNDFLDGAIGTVASGVLRYDRGGIEFAEERK